MLMDNLWENHPQIKNELDDTRSALGQEIQLNRVLRHDLNKWKDRALEAESKVQKNEKEKELGHWEWVEEIQRPVYIRNFAPVQEPIRYGPPEPAKPRLGPVL